MKKIFIKTKKIHTIGAFTVVELIVTVSIMAVLSAVIFWNGRQFNDKIEVNSAAEEVSLAIRQAQNYGSTVREKSSGTGLFNVGYGITFDTANPTFIIIFADNNGNKIYDGGTTCTGGDECLEKIILRNGVTINNLCAVPSSSISSCSLRSVQATFLRPNLNAIISALDAGGIPVPGSWLGAQAVLQSRKGALKTVTISFTGQISVQ